MGSSTSTTINIEASGPIDLVAATTIIELLRERLSEAASGGAASAPKVEAMKRALELLEEQERRRRAAQ